MRSYLVGTKSTCCCDSDLIFETGRMHGSECCSAHERPYKHILRRARGPMAHAHIHISLYDQRMGHVDQYGQSQLEKG